MIWWVKVFHDAYTQKTEDYDLRRELLGATFHLSISEEELLLFALGTSQPTVHTILERISCTLTPAPAPPPAPSPCSAPAPAPAPAPTTAHASVPSPSPAPVSTLLLINK